MLVFVGPTLYYKGPLAPYSNPLPYPIGPLGPGPLGQGPHTIRCAGNAKCGENRNHGKFKIYFLMVEL